jgi:hypothetical protein
MIFAPAISELLALNAESLPGPQSREGVTLVDDDGCLWREASGGMRPLPPARRRLRYRALRPRSENHAHLASHVRRVARCRRQTRGGRVNHNTNGRKFLRLKPGRQGVQKLFGSSRGGWGPTGHCVPRFICEFHRFFTTTTTLTLEWLAKMADQMIVTIDVPKLGEMLLGNASRAHNRIARQATREVLLDHWRKRIPLHFKRSAHSRYHYAERSPRYRFQKQKRYGSSIDLVRTGRTRDLMSSVNDAGIRISGTAAGGTLAARLTLRFPFKGGSRRYRGFSRQQVTIEQMAREIETFTPDEVSQMVGEVRDRYINLVKTTTSPRQQVKL